MARSFDFSTVLASYFTAKQLEKINTTTVGIAGTGGLGSNCAQILVRSGFSRFVFVDFDRVEVSNLNRQAFYPSQIGTPKVQALLDNLRLINPAVEAQTHQVAITADNRGDFFSDCDVIVEAFDAPGSKALLVETWSGSGKLVVCASGIAGYGGSDRIRTRAVGSLRIIGDSESEVSGACKPYSPCVMIAAAKQADSVLEWVLQDV